MIKEFWRGLSLAARASFAGGVALLLAMMIAATTWLLRTDYEILFAGLSAPDAAAMTAELDRMKLPYKLGPDGASILVDRTSVHQTRLKLLGKDIPLHGAVGFELFNNSDFGMTEFAQKINYQRALQGELTRTILSLTEVETARVHLAFPEEGLFRREQAKAKASVTLGMRRNQTLRQEQVNGIQRLISAAVPGVAPHDVTIVNTQGVALTRPVGQESTPDFATRLELKREIEQHLVRKANDVLEKAFGAGRALTSVDVTLNMNQVRVTTEDVTAPRSETGTVRTGVIVRERETVKEEGAPLASREGKVVSAGNTHRETEYQVGRRVEQVVSQPGSIERMQIVAVINAPLNPSQIGQVRVMLGAAVGISVQRGDVIVVQPIDAIVTTGQPGTAPPTRGPTPAIGDATEVLDSSPEATRSPGKPMKEAASATTPASALLALLTALVIVVVLMQRWWVGRRPRAATTQLSDVQREQTLAQVRAWLGEAYAPPREAMGVNRGR